VRLPVLLSLALILMPIAAARTQSVSPTNPLATQTLESLSASRDRPLFSPSRRPYAPPPTAVRRAPASPPPTPPALVLLGIVVDADGARAFVRAAEGKTVRLRIGEEISGWSVAQIEQRRLVLSLADRNAVFTLFGGARSKRGSPSEQAAIARDLPVQSRSGR
jgi:general secretion pathway protein N